MIRKLLLICAIGLGMLSCENTPSAQAIVDRAIAVSGGERYSTHTLEFYFRGRMYRLTREAGQRILWRHTYTDSGEIKDKLTSQGLQRFYKDSLINIPDSLARKYGNSVNSVHYFAYLPYGLNDAAVLKKGLGRTHIRGIPYQQVEIRFQKEGGGVDFEDVFLYWFNEGTGKPDYLAYEYHTDGGGTRFRVAKNERYVNGIRFVDYDNYKPKEKGIALSKLDSLYQDGSLEMLSEIKLDSIRVIPGNCN